MEHQREERKGIRQRSFICLEEFIQISTVHFRRTETNRRAWKQLVDGTAHREDLVWAGLAQGLSAAGLLVQAIEQSLVSLRKPGAGSGGLSPGSSQGGGFPPLLRLRRPPRPPSPERTFLRLRLQALSTRLSPRLLRLPGESEGT